MIDDAVLDAAAATIGRHGLAGATLERVARAAGLSRVTLHRRGIDRAALVAGLTARAEAEFREALWPALTGPGTGAERLEQALQGDVLGGRAAHGAAAGHRRRPASTPPSTRAARPG